MLKIPGNAIVEQFLERYWQKRALFMPGALDKLRPAITRNEIGWLATLEDVESRIVFIDRGGARRRYKVEDGPFDPEYLQNLPKRDWTLLVHDVEKHLPAMRALFDHIPFIPDWRIDDLMVSFAAPGGSVGPHRDYYDVFLCQGIGRRNWRFTTDTVDEDPKASADLALLREFDDGDSHDTTEGDVLYLPPGIAHWGVAQRACITYSIGMRAPQISDLSGSVEGENRFYTDPDLLEIEAQRGYISPAAVQRVRALLGQAATSDIRLAETLGRFVTQTKDWLTPEGADSGETDAMLGKLQVAGAVFVHGMARIAFDETKLYVNGASMTLPPEARHLVHHICNARAITRSMLMNAEHAELLQWMLERGAFELADAVGSKRQIDPKT